MSQRMPRRARDILPVLTGLALVVGCSPVATAPSGASPAAVVPASGQAGAQACAWPEEVDPYSSNTVIPDTADVVWIDSFSVAPGLRIVLSGTFPFPLSTLVAEGVAACLT